ncbi:hypothetical protein AAFN88_16820 [Pelagibius sp. CAU 1746]|uniref:hypothetical protein n=1 Tax=Pelagibius sp. CAU 1746 TaxID=3140370 RepID=UPI00325ACEFF
MIVRERRLRGAVLALSMIAAFWISVCHGLAQEGEVPMPDPDVDYAWQLGDDEARELIQKIKSLRYGDKLDDVRKLLGKASRDIDLFDKKRKFSAHLLEYPIRRVRPEGGNLYDQEIHLFFDELGRLTEIGYNAMRPLMGDIIDKGMGSRTGTEFFLTRPPARQQSE